ncbi:outer membrane protein, YaiO family [Chitinophaga sp. CF118]|uniref:YaiO family outer membrane beta-barrel protein n=1 Tax=Chitinophaga sp. CF118 TaxID=1884367 RepID=UPI0008EFD1A3|nr:YaiO family outer membrane beta-barrel protein [Chitinophaga sp. CF118]SFD76183.1 outer membrane protein, YaiO family [Chitinophaga sp. CF118]
MNLKIKLLIFIVMVTVSVVSAQSYTADELFQRARTAAFDQKDYPQAIMLCNQALVNSPDYEDIRIFLGRLYTWSKKTDSARIAFTQVLNKEPDNEDASFAYGNLEYWNDNYETALQICNSGLKYHEQSTDLLMLKAKLLNAMRRFAEANTVVTYLLKIDSRNTAARSLADRIKDNSSKNKIGISYDFVKFDKRFDNPWHLASIDYTRQTGIGAVIARINYANRFSTNGTQVELDAYPHISPTFYAYVNGGYSNTVGVFPRYRAGFSLYANLPASFEAEAGFRYLNFGDATWIYTASLGKYYKNYWLNLRTFLTPSNNAVSQSYSLNVRYYFGGADDFFRLGIGTGISPDDPRNNILLNNNKSYKLKSHNISGGFHYSLKKLNVIYLNVSLDYQEYQRDTRGIQLDIGVGYQRRF